MTKSKFAKIKSLDDAEVGKLFKHVLKEVMDADPAEGDKCDINDLKELIEIGNLEVELIVHYDPAPNESKPGTTNKNDDDDF